MWKPIFLALILCGCASSDEEQAYSSNVHPAAWGADGFNVYTPAPEREKNPDAKFYFKECDPSGGKTYYSHTSYICDER